MIKLDSKLPTFYNGLDEDEFKKELLENPKETRVAIIYFDCPKITTDTFAGFDADDPTIRIRKIEPLFGEIKERVESIYQEAYSERTGVTEIPFDAERDAKDNGTKKVTIITGKPKKKKTTEETTDEKSA